MPTATTQVASSPVRASGLWQQIVEITREACVLRQEERESEAVVLLQQKLPPIIRSWSASCGAPADTCRQRLRELFASEQEQMRAALMQRRLIVDEVVSRLQVRAAATNATTSASAVVLTDATRPVQLRRRIPFNDVEGMLDALQEAERGAVTEAILPVRRALQSLSSVGHRPLTAAAFG